ncbi:MAG: serine/threonine protein kinase, partial [Actinomycetota bacterium]|nr:serine/threonine protein kinase [Actinomycetota bacterium]
MTFTVTGYRVEQLLGSGGQAEVWAGQSIATGERVALKRIVVDSPATARAARSEAALLGVLDHPSLIQLREFVVTESAMVLVMELAEAGSLAQLLRRRDRLSPAEVVATISPVAAALAHAHDQGVLHADVSAANILFTAAGQPKLADLGVARLLAGSGEAIGTPAYVDPVIAAGGAAGAASDVFSLAAVALHALTGTGPWQCPVTGSAGRAAARSARAPVVDVAQVLAVAATGEIADLAERLAGFEPAIAEVLTRALDPAPDRRGTAAEFALDLRAALTPAPVVLAGGRILTKVGRHSTERRDREREAFVGRPPFGLAADVGPATGLGPATDLGPATGLGPGLGRGLGPGSGIGRGPVGLT